MSSDFMTLHVRTLSPLCSLLPMCRRCYTVGVACAARPCAAASPRAPAAAVSFAPGPSSPAYYLTYLLTHHMSYVLVLTGMGMCCCLVCASAPGSSNLACNPAQWSPVPSSQAFAPTHAAPSLRLQTDSERVGGAPAWAGARATSRSIPA